jgi:hypothetical protein
VLGFAPSVACQRKGSKSSKRSTTVRLQAWLRPSAWRFRCRRDSRKNTVIP